MCRTLLNRRARRDGSASAPAPPRCAASGASQGSPSDASTTSSSGQTDRSGSHGSASRSTPAAAATAPLTSRPGNGNSTFAHTPSARPGEAPSTTDSRCVSQRSTPRVGTATTSACSGSASGALDDAGERIDKAVRPFRSVDVKHAGDPPQVESERSGRGSQQVPPAWKSREFIRVNLLWCISTRGQSLSSRPTLPSA